MNRNTLLRLGVVQITLALLVLIAAVLSTSGARYGLFALGAALIATGTSSIAVSRGRHRDA